MILIDKTTKFKTFFIKTTPIFGPKTKFKIFYLNLLRIFNL